MANPGEEKEEKKVPTTEDYINGFRNVTDFSKNDFDYAYRHDNDDIISKFRESEEKLVEKGMLYQRGRDGMWRRVTRPGFLEADSLADTMIRTSPNAAPYVLSVDEDGKYVMSDAPVKDADILTQFLTGKEPPSKPDSWGPFQFLKYAANAISKAFGGKGLREYREYEEERRDFDTVKYYALKSAGYKPQKPDYIQQSERETAVDYYLQARSESIVEGNRNNIDFIGEDNPLEKPEAMKKIRQDMINSPKIDEFVNNPDTQAVIISSKLNAATSGQSTFEASGNKYSNFLEHGNKLAYENVNKYLAEELHRRVQQKKAEAPKEPERKSVMDDIRKNSGIISQDVGKMLDKNIPEAQKNAFLHELNNCMAVDTPHAWGIRHFLQESVRNDSGELMNRLCEDFNANKNGPLPNILKGFVDPVSDGCFAIKEYGNDIPEKLQVKQAEICNAVEQRVNKPETVSNGAAKAPDAPDKKMGGPVNG